MTAPYGLFPPDPRRRRAIPFGEDMAPAFQGTRGALDRLSGSLMAYDPAAAEMERERQAVESLIAANLEPVQAQPVPRGQMIVDAAIGGLAQQEPGAGGVAGFLSDVARSAGAARGAGQRLTGQSAAAAQQAEAARQERLLAALRARGELDLRRAQADRARREETPRGQASEPAAVARLRFLQGLTEEELADIARRERMLNPPSAPSVTFQQAPGFVGPDGSPMVFNPRTGKYETAGAPPGTVGAPKPLTEGQANAAGFADRLDAADAFFSSDNVRVPNELERLGAGLPIANRFVAGDAQVFRNQERQFITAQLRRESGAAISPSEFAEARALYIPQAGDKPETLAVKAQNRRIAREAMRRGAGGNTLRLPGVVDPGQGAGAATGAGAAPNPWDKLREEYE